MKQMRFDCLSGHLRRQNLWILDPQSCARWACRRGWQSSCFCSSHLFACRRAVVWSHSALLWCTVLPADDSRYWCWFHWLQLFCHRLGYLSERLANRRPHSLCTGQPTIQFKTLNSWRKCPSQNKTSLFPPDLLVFSFLSWLKIKKIIKCSMAFVLI